MKQSRRWSVGPDAVIPVGLSGTWTLAMPGPKLFGTPRKSNWCVGLNIGTTIFVERIRPEGPGRPLEELDALVQRAATLYGTAEPFTFAYGSGPIA